MIARVRARETGRGRLERGRERETVSVRARKTERRRIERNRERERKSERGL